MASLTFILGGARSGKSALAARLAEQSGKQVIYIATATALDDEMHERITRHQEDRPPHWKLVEAPRLLSDAIATHAAPEHCLLIDCLTLWLTNLLHDAAGTPLGSVRLQEQFSALGLALAQAPGDIVVVANEVGLGIMPLGELTRRFVDEAGRLNQAIAQQADRVLFVAAGLPLTLKSGKESL